MHEKNDPFEGEWVGQVSADDLRDAGVDVDRNFQCLMLSKGAINDDLRELLVRQAVSMVCLKQTRHRIRTDWCEGGLKTDFTHAGLEGFSGLKFECEVDVSRKTVKATFIVGSALLERFRDAAWYFEQAEQVQLKTSYFN